MRSDDKTVAIDDVVCIRETAKAILIQPVDERIREDDRPSLWIPKSQIHQSSSVNILGDVGVLVISEWIFNAKKAEKDGKGWAGFSHVEPEEGGPIR